MKNLVEHGQRESNVANWLAPVHGPVDDKTFRCMLTCGHVGGILVHSC